MKALGVSNLWNRYFHARYAAARPYLLCKLFLSMVALDTWMLMIGHAGRYGVDGFNVAQFGWLDRLAPQPTAALYVGVLVLTGLLSLTIALCGSHPLAMFALFSLYTYSWSMSMLDSYQHHYFVSSILACLIFFPRLCGSDVHALAELPQLQSPAAPAKKLKQADTAAHEAALRSERNGTLYCLACALPLVAYFVVPAGEHPWLLFCSCAFAVAAATIVYARSKLRAAGAPQTTLGFGFNLLGATVGVLYVYTSIAKLDAQWLAGHTILRISSADKVFAPAVGWFGAHGIPAERFWSLVASSVIPVELTIASGYFLSLLQDSGPRWLRWACSLACLLAISLHVGAEAMQLEIGWFSYYMMLLACVFLLPARAVDTLATLFTWPARFISQQLADETQKATASKLSASLPALALTTVAALLLVLVGKAIDLPGALSACGVAAVTLFALVLVASVRGRAPALRPLLLGSTIAAMLMWFAIAHSEVRWDFYRYLGGDLRRRNQPEAALEAYQKGERYAPKGQTRRDKIQELKHQLGR